VDQLILKLLARRDYRPSNIQQLLGLLKLGRPQLPQLEEALRALERTGQILHTKADRYILAREADLIPGVIRVNRQGKGFLQPDDPALQEIVIPESATSTALHCDRVLVRRDPAKANKDRPGALTGAVVRILERKRAEIVGTLQRSKQFLFVIPDDPRIPHDVYVAEPRDLGRPVNVGDKVVVELREWISRHTNPEGVIIEALGAPDTEGVDMLSVLRNYHLPLHFPREVLEAAEAIARPRQPLGGQDQARADSEPTEVETQGRIDCRAHRVITIDPDDAKDFDDAICVERQEQNWRVWVHIADVSHYVPPGSVLDEEARQRGNSTYLVDRVIPMLPEALSNGLCSLHPKVDRLTKCVEFLLSEDGRVVKTNFYAAVIRSQRRFTYKEAFAILKRRPAADPIEQLLHRANDLAQRLRRARFKAGSLDLDFPETKIRLDSHGKVAALERVENDVSHQLIEEFMLLANEAVAARLTAQRRPSVYRVHEAPNPLRLQEYREDVLSHRIPCGNLSQRGEVQKLLQRLNAHPVGAALKIGFLKSLMRARYAVEPLGHYGLAKVNYTHFTSPIRRYADLIVHRSLFERVRTPAAALAQAAAHISETERNSADAERDSKEVKLYAYLNEQLKSGKLEKYAGLVIDVRNFGFFIDVPTLGLSGLVHLSSMEDDFYVFEPDRGHLIGRRTRRIIKMGESVQAQIAKVDTFKKQVDFKLVGKIGARAKNGGAN
jgi:ribonuclease R